MKKKPPISSESRHLRLLVLLLATAVILPTVCLLWFLSQAVDNERLVVRQRLVDVYEQQADELLQEFNASYTSMVQDWIEIVEEHSLKTPFYDVHSELGRGNIGDYPGLVVFGRDQGLIYPGPKVYEYMPLELPWAFQAAWELEFEREDLAAAIESYEELAGATNGYVRLRSLLAAVRCERKQGNIDRAMEICQQVVADPNLGLTDAARTLQVSSQIILVEMGRETESDALESELTKLGEMALDFNLSLDTRMFTWEKYKGFMAQTGIGSAKTEPAERVMERQLAAEQLSMVAKERFGDASEFKDWEEGTIQNLETPEKGYGIFFRGEDREFLVIEPPLDFSNFREALADTLVGFVVLDNQEKRVAGVGADEEYDSESVFLTMKVGEHFPNWWMEFYFRDDDVFALAAARQNAIYLWAVILVVVLVVVAGALAVRLVGREIRLNRLKNNFVATVSHELKTPLTSIRMLVDMLFEGRYQDQQEAQEYLQLVMKENERLTRLIDNFLTFSRLERNKQRLDFGAVAPGKIAETAAEAVKTKFKKHQCQLEVEVEASLPEMMVDFDAMVVVLVNLLDNGCKYSKDDNKRVRLKVFQQDGMIGFVVSDNGIGLPKQVQRKIFDRFYQVDQRLIRQGEGVGLGLSIVKFIVEAHHGTIKVESQEGQGSSFRVKVPVDR